MMERQWLIIVLAVVYLVECIFWVRRGALLFRRVWFKRWRMAEPGEMGGNFKGGLCWSNPLPPFGKAYVAGGFPFSLSPHGILGFTAECLNRSGRPVQSAKWFLFEDVKAVTADEKRLRVNGEIVWRSDSVHQPAALVTLLRELRGMSVEERETRITAELAGRFDRDGLRRIQTEGEGRTKPLQRLACSLFLFIFLICPFALARFGSPIILWSLLTVLLAHTATAAILFHRAHRHFFPHAGDDRFKLTSLVLLAPAVTLRARDLIERLLLERFHPLALAAEFLERREFVRFARERWRDLEYPALPVCPSEERSAQEIEQWFRRTLQAQVVAFLNAVRVEPQSWLAAPQATDPTHEQFCPRCETQFTSRASDCAECGGRKLESLIPK